MDGGRDSVSRHPSPLVLVRMSGILELGSRITIHVGLTGKSAAARVVLVSRERPFEYGIALDEPQIFWGISLPPADWRG